MQITAGEASQSDLERKWQVDVTIRGTVKEAALAALSRAPGRPGKERN